MSVIVQRNAGALLLTSAAGTPHSLSAVKYISDCEIGVRQSHSPHSSSVGVRTWCTSASGERRR